MSDDLRYDDAYRCGFCQGRVYVSGRTTLHYRCASCGLAPVMLIQPNAEDRKVTLTLKVSEVALLYSMALRQREEYEWYNFVIRGKWEDIIGKLSRLVDHGEELDQ